MGKVYDKIVNSSINNSKEIACVDTCDFLLVSSVSNWASYAIAAGIFLLKNKK